MSRVRIGPASRWLGFAALLVASAVAREGDSSALDMAVVWLPTGVAIAGVSMLGARAAWVVLAATMLQRLFLGYGWGMGLTGAVGSTCEALLGAFVLDRLGLQRSFTRLRDVGAVLAAAAIAPLGSILCSWPARVWVWDLDMPFYSGWDGWWRMNALGAIMVLPVTFAWAATPRRDLRRGLARDALTGCVAIAAVLLGLLPLLPQGATGVLWLNLVLVAIAMFGAAHFGMRGAALGTLVAVLVVVAATMRGIGPFVDLPRTERHVALQLFALALVALPSAFGAILAERKAAEDAARRSEALLTSINRNVQDGLFRVDADLRLIYANPALVRLFGYAAPGLAQRIPTEVFAEASRLEEIVAAIHRAEHVNNEEVLFRRPDGTTFWGLLSGAVVRDASGAVVHYDGAITDVTTRKALEDQVRQSQKMEAVGRLAGGIAHDFNNLLTVIIGYAEALRDHAHPRDPVAEHAEAICAAGTRAAALTHQLLAYSRRQVLTPQVIDASDVVLQMAGMLERIIGEDVRLVVERGGLGCWVRVDRSQLEQVLVNLAVNARDAMERGGTLTLSTSLDEVDEATARAHPDRIAGPCVMIRVRDTGVGMGPDVLEQAFEPFFTTKEPGRGTGLGLATVYGIVRQSGGSVWLESTPGQGTTACIALPCTAAPQSVGGRVLVASAPPRRTGTVLVVEDEEGVLTLISTTLARRGHEVLAASDGTRALDIAEIAGGHFDLVITDVVMPGMDGRELALRLRARWPGTPVLFISGYSDGGGAAEAFKSPGSGFLAKPFSPEVLLARVDTMLRPPSERGASGSVPVA
jgi:PAS domain S-box-containing protein